MFKSRINKEFSELRQRFRTFYDTELSGDYAELEQNRKVYLKSFYIRLAVVLTVLLCKMCFTSANGYVGGVLSVLVVILGIFLWRPVVNFKQKTKKIVIDKILSFFGNLSYCDEPSALQNKEVLAQSMLFDEFSERTADDCFEGECQGRKIAVSEQQLRFVGDVDGEKQKYCVFKGVVISLEMPQTFNGRTVARFKENLNNPLTYLSLYDALVLLSAAILGGVGLFIPLEKVKLIFFVGGACVFGYFLFSLYQKWLAKKRLLQREVRLDEVSLNKKWQVWSDDAKEAESVLRPDFLKRIIEVKKRFMGDDIEVSFWDNKMTIAVYTRRNLFETTSLFSKSLRYGKIEEVVCQFYSVLSLAGAR